MSAVAQFGRPSGTQGLLGEFIPAVNRWAILTYPYGALLEIWLTVRLKPREVVQIQRNRIVAHVHMDPIDEGMGRR